MLNNINLINYNSCTGCSACYSICPIHCITMEDDEEGFKNPVVDVKKCINCGKCLSVCPVNEIFVKRDNFKPKVFAAWNLDNNVRLNSTSGGLFTAFAENILSNNGYVVGAEYDSNFLPVHRIISDLKDIEKLRQSKYAQSDKQNIFSIVKKKLNDEPGKNLLFVGSPCEVAALYKFLGRKYNNLISIDFICLSNNSPKVLRKFLDDLESVYNSKVSKLWFKNKTYGWNMFATKVEFENGKYYLKNRYYDYFMRGFIGKEKLYMRKSCAECKYRIIPRVSDITLADFWGASLIDKNLDNEKGTSLVLINSASGEQLFQSLEDKIFYKECELDDAIAGNLAIFKSPILSENREKFFKELTQKNFFELIDKYAPINRNIIIKSKIKKLIFILKKGFNLW